MRVVSRSFGLVALLLGAWSLPGCGPDNSTSEIKNSPEAVKADEAGRKAIEEFMKNQQKTKKAAKTSPTSPVAPRP